MMPEWVRTEFFALDKVEAIPQAWRLYGIAGWLEAMCWVLLAAAGLTVLARNLPRLSLRTVPHAAWLLLAVGAAARLSVPFRPMNWYFGVGNLPIGRFWFTKASSYLPLPNRLVAFDLGFGFNGLVAFNVALGVASVLILWQAARWAGYGEKAATAFALLLATTPMYVRLSASDSSQVMCLFLWACAALSFTAVLRRVGGGVAHVALFAATVLACPIRLESAGIISSAALFAGAGVDGWKEIARDWRRFLAFWAALAVGGVIALAYHTQTLAVRQHGLLNIVFSITTGAPFRLTGLLNLWPPYNFPPIIAVLYLYHLMVRLRARDWREVAGSLVPVIFVSLPFLIGEEVIFCFLNEAAYNIIAVVFYLTPAGKGLVEFARRLSEQPPPVWKRVAAAGLAIPLLWLFILVPYRRTVVFQDELRFLQDQLPGGPATILTIWDPWAQANTHSWFTEFDCCLALPYPTFLGDRPELKWIVLTAEDLQSGRLGTLSFDYYYPGTLSRLETERRDPWSLQALTPALRERDVQRAKVEREHVRILKRLDEEVRRRFRLTPAASRRITARHEPLLARGCDGIDIGFPDPELELTIYRRPATEVSAR